MNVGTAELRNRLSHFLKEVLRGKRVVVMDRGRPIAQIVPYDASADPLRAEILDMEAEGVVSTRAGRARRPVEAIPLHRSDLSAAQVASDLRGGR